MQNGYHTAKVEWIKDETIPEEELGNYIGNPLKLQKWSTYNLILLSLPEHLLRSRS